MVDDLQDHQSAFIHTGVGGTAPFLRSCVGLFEREVQKVTITVVLKCCCAARTLLTNEARNLLLEELYVFLACIGLYA